MSTSKKILILTGDAGESFEILFAVHRMKEAGYIPVIAAPSVRRLNLVIHDFEPEYIQPPSCGELQKVFQNFHRHPR